MGAEEKVIQKSELCHPPTLHEDNLILSLAFVHERFLAFSGAPAARQPACGAAASSYWAGPREPRVPADDASGRPFYVLTGGRGTLSTAIPWIRKAPRHSGTSSRCFRVQALQGAALHHQDGQPFVAMVRNRE